MDELILVEKADGTVDEFFEGFLRAMEGNPSLLRHADDVEIRFGGTADPMSANAKARLKHFLSDPDAGNPWKLDDPQWVADEPPPIPHNFYARGLLLEIQQYKKFYKNQGYQHNPTAVAVDFTSEVQWVQLKTLKNPNNAVGVMKKAIIALADAAEEYGQLPNKVRPEKLKLHIVKRPGSSSDQLDAALGDFIENDSSLRGWVDVDFTEF